MAFYSQIQLSENKIIFCKELKVKHLKIIYKCLLGDEIDSHLLFFNLNKILKKITKNIDVESIHFIDFFILLLELRCSSMGNIITLQLSEDTTLEINLYKIIEELKNIQIDEILKQQTKENITIHYKLPTINEIIELNNKTDSIQYFFIKGFSLENEIYTFKNIFECEEIFKKIPAKFFSDSFKKINEIIYYFNNIDLLKYNEKLKEKISLYFNFNIKNLSILTRLLFGNQLMSLYENIFALCKLGNFTPEYIENCSPGEYFLLVKKLEEINKQNNNTSQNSDLQQSEFDESLSEEEPLNPYDSPNLPPITSQFTG